MLRQACLRRAEFSRVPHRRKPDGEGAGYFPCAFRVLTTLDLKNTSDIRYKAHLHRVWL